MNEKAGSILNTCERWPVCYTVRGDFRVAANCSPAVASRRAKYDGDFRVIALLGAQPPDQTARASQTRIEKHGHVSRTRGERKASARTHTVRPPSTRQDAQANHHAWWKVCTRPRSAITRSATSSSPEYLFCPLKLCIIVIDEFYLSVLSPQPPKFLNQCRARTTLQLLMCVLVPSWNEMGTRKAAAQWGPPGWLRWAPFYGSEEAVPQGLTSSLPHDAGALF
jgi:hypothetical protein